MAEEFHSAREVGMAIDALRESIVALRDQMNAKFDGLCGQLTLMKWVMGGFGAVTVAAFAYLFTTTTQTTVAVAEINPHLVSVDARLESTNKRLDAIEIRMDKRFEEMDRRFDTLTTLIMNLQPPLKRTEGFTLAPGQGREQ